MVAFTLTEEQRAALSGLSGGEAIPVFDPQENRAYFLVPADVYEQLRGKAEDDETEFSGLGPMMDEIADREGWNDPEMDVYDQLDPRRQS